MTSLLYIRKANSNFANNITLRYFIGFINDSFVRYFISFILIKNIMSTKGNELIYRKTVKLSCHCIISISSLFT